MAGALKIKTGTKMRVAFDVPIGQEPSFELLCTFNKSIDESAFLVSIPMKDGRPVSVDEDQKLLMRYEMGGEQVIVAGYVDDIVKQGIRRYWKVRRVQEQRHFFQRADERVKVGLHLEYMQDNWKPDADGKIAKEEGLTLDISGGGVAMYANRRFDVGETVFITLQSVGSDGEGSIDELVGVVCWMREAPKGSVFRNICGIQFRFGDETEKKTLQDYITFVKKRYKVS